MKITPASNLVFKYLALPMGLGGRGGVQRFFLLSQGIPFEEKLFDMGDEWATEKARLKSSGENPCATSPVVMADNIPLPQHIAGSRFLSAVHGCTAGGDDANYNAFVQDLVADEYQGFRDAWVRMAFEGTDEQKAAYKKDELPGHLTKFNELYQQFKTHDVFLSISAKTQQPLWGDAALYGLLRDHTITGFMTEGDLKEYPCLKNMFETYGKIPAVAAWVAKANEASK